MNGITILSESATLSSYGTFCLYIAITIIFTGIAFGVFTKEYMCFAYGICASLIFIFNMITSMIPTYKISIDDTVLFNEFMNNYEIISTEGDIYTVKPKGDINEN